MASSRVSIGFYEGFIEWCVTWENPLSEALELVWGTE